MNYKFELNYIEYANEEHTTRRYETSEPTRYSDLMDEISSHVQHNR